MRTRRSLIDLDDLAIEELDGIFSRAAAFEERRPEPRLAHTACVNIFFEPSTRTFTSFNLAQLRLGADVVNLTPTDMSYLTKGESIEDTVLTLSAMGVAVLVVRHPVEHYPEQLAKHFDGHVVNAGDGAHAHPTQGLLDLYTLLQDFGSLHGRCIAIVGDVLHSRVAHSVMAGLRRLESDVVLVGPNAFVPSAYATDGVRVERELDAVLPEVDAVMLLRIQRERLTTMPIAQDEYVARYRLDARRLSLLKSDALVLHPGPYNRGVELDDSVFRFPGWRYRQQVLHGVSVRMAVLDLLVNGT